MGFDATLLTTDLELDDGALHRLGLVSAGSQVEFAQVVDGTPGVDAAVLRTGRATVVLTRSVDVAAAFETERITFDGTWHVVSTVSSAGFDDYRVFRGGRLVRHLIVSDDEVADRGEPVIDESAFVFSGAEPALDGELAIQFLPAAAGVLAPEQNLLDLSASAHHVTS